MVRVRFLKNMLLAVGLAGCVLDSPAMAWGPNGHAVVADIAEDHLTPAARKAVMALLATEGHHHLSEIASWADSVRHEYRSTSPWHFADIPLTAPGYDSGRDCRGGNCVVEIIGRAAPEMIDPKASTEDRVAALKWVTHFVGDIHQPLHVSDNHDLGGNKIKLMFFGNETNLHSIWDDAILDHATGLTVGPNFSVDPGADLKVARELDAAVSPANKAAWSLPVPLVQITPNAITWANEAHALAPTAYARPLPGNEEADKAYEARCWPIVAVQLQRAGLRLAAVLNGTFQ